MFTNVWHRKTYMYDVYSWQYLRNLVRQEGIQCHATVCMFYLFLNVEFTTTYTSRPVWSVERTTVWAVSWVFIRKELWRSIKPGQWIRYVTSERHWLPFKSVALGFFTEFSKCSQDTYPVDFKLRHCTPLENNEKSLLKKKDSLTDSRLSSLRKLFTLSGMWFIYHIFKNSVHGDVFLVLN